MTLAEAVRAAAARLRAAGADTPDLDARVLAQEAFGLSAARLVAQAGSAPPEDGLIRLDMLVRRRAAGEPVARILGRREFWGLDFSLARETLEPRPDTETIVEAALAHVGDRARPLRLLDLGTGSGCILIALMSELPNAFGVGVDLSPPAAAAARRNAEALGFGERCRFIAGSWARALRGPFDLVVSNPPYIATADITALDVEVKDHDPRLALDGGADGLDAYRAIVSDLPRLLGPGAAAILELGAGQLDAVSAEARLAGLSCLGARADLGGTARAITLGPA